MTDNNVPTVFDVVPEDVLPPSPEESGKRRRMLILITVVAVLLALILGMLAWYLVTRKPLTQLPALSLSIPPAYSTAFYGVDRPLGIAIDEPNNRLYVTESGGKNRAVVLDLDGNEIGTLQLPMGKTQMTSPVYVAVDPKTSDVYVSDRAAGTIYVFDSTGSYLREFKPAGAKRWQPLALAFDPDGNLYASDVSGPDQRVVQLTTDGKVLRTFGDHDALQFPNGLQVLSNGTLAVADSNNGRVLIYGGNGKLVGGLARGDSNTPLGLPRGMTLDQTGRLYVVDTSQQAVQVFKAGDDGLPTYSTSFGEEGGIDGAFEYPNAIAADSIGRLYITDRENNRVQVWSY
jgi:DNA-binding beta-propeller fold protein YncE